MDLRQLRYFVTIAELGSFTAAASRLNIVQSALSRQIANLEADLGASLFYRDGRRLRLAPAGERLKTAAEKILLEVEDLRVIVQQCNDEVAGPVGLGAHPSDGDVILPRIFNRIHADFPGIQLDPVQAMTAVLQEMLLKGRLDFAILTFPDPLPGLDVDPIAREHVYLVGPADNFPFDGDECTMTQALGVPLVASHHPSRERRALEGLSKKHGIPLTVTVEADGLPLMKLLSQQGRGAIFLPETAVQAEKDDPRWRLARIRDFAITRFLARRSSQTQSKAMATVLTILLEEVEALKVLGIMH